METDAKGQLGGLETSDAVRRRLATESQSFRCGICGKTNVDIMKECEERAKESDLVKATEVEIPPELKMGWKDDMVKQATDASSVINTDSGAGIIQESAELAEGFVRTGSPRQEPDADTSSISPPARVGVTRRIDPTLSVQPPTLQHEPQQLQRPPADVPLWIDRSIAIVIVLLAAMLLKILLTGLSSI